MEQVGANRVSVAERLGVASGSGPSTVKTFTFTDPDGIDDFTILNVLINNALDGRSACYLAYEVPSSTLCLVNESGKGFDLDFAAFGGECEQRTMHGQRVGGFGRQERKSGQFDAEPILSKRLRRGQNTLHRGSRQGRKQLWLAGPRHPLRRVGRWTWTRAFEPFRRELDTYRWQFGVGAVFRRL